MILLMSNFRSLDSEAPEDGGDEAEDETEDRQPQYKARVTTHSNINVCVPGPRWLRARGWRGARAEPHWGRGGQAGQDWLRWLVVSPSLSLYLSFVACVSSSGMSSAGTERAGLPAPTFKYCLEIQRHLTEETECWWKENIQQQIFSSFPKIMSGKQRITSPPWLPINTCIVFLPLIWLVDVIVFITNTLNLFWWGLWNLMFSMNKQIRYTS